MPRIHHWDVLTQARAIENQAWLLACNQVGAQPGIDLGGHSCAVSPQGEVIGSLGSGEAILRARVEPAQAEQWRADFPALGDIRLT